MSELLDLSSYKTKLSELISHSSMDDCELPLDFKTKFKGFGDYRVERYNRYTTLISSRKSILTIPNQWIYIAACCCQYYLELMKYRNRLLELGITEDEFEACHPSKDNKNIPEEEKTPRACKEKAEKFLNQYSGSDKTLLVNFLWNYNSWGGGKNIKRSNDFTVSPVLNIANTINASSSLIGDIAKGLANQLECLDKLLKSDKWTEFYIPHAVNNASWKENPISFPLQQIYYGAPGTGKSFEIKGITKVYSTIRTTFHPDSDYSTFVGAYKPTMKIVDLRDLSGHIVEGVKEERIVYTYVKQAFLKAYLGAWQKYAKGGDTAEPQFLVIEEINRGNCAQIFGDLFQLLDRSDNGFSSYPIEADSDLQKEIEIAFGVGGEYALENDFNVDDVVDDYTSNYDKSSLTDDIKSGRILLLPNNLFIWATMNTSDQSLFPIDSAFKRRWDWKYVKIADAHKGWMIKCGNEACDWWTFVEAINKEIADKCESEDKKLGYFFCKPKGGEDVIDEERFVGKVMFYLWNDVFKDIDTSLFKLQGETEETPTFDAFYTQNEKGESIADIKAIRQFLLNVVGEDNLILDFAENNTTISTKNSPRFVLDGNGIPDNMMNVVRNMVQKYADAHHAEGVDSIMTVFNEVCNDKDFYIANGFILETEAQHQKRMSQKKKTEIAVELDLGERGKLYVNRYWTNKNREHFIRKAKEKQWGIIEPVKQ